MYIMLYELQRAMNTESEDSIVNNFLTNAKQIISVPSHSMHTKVAVQKHHKHQ